MRDRTKKRIARAPLADYGVVDIWKYYKSEYGKLDEKTFKAIVKEFNKKVSHIIVTESFEFMIPRNLGTIRIRKNKPKLRIKEGGKVDKKFLIPDWKATWELWEEEPETRVKGQIIYMENKHTEGYIHRWHYSRFNNSLKNKSVYCFLPSRTNKILLAEVLNNLEKYPDLDYYN